MASPCDKGEGWQVTYVDSTMVERGDEGANKETTYDRADKEARCNGSLTLVKEGARGDR
jgi:hypothetical protein